MAIPKGARSHSTDIGAFSSARLAALGNRRNKYSDFRSDNIIDSSNLFDCNTLDTLGVLCVREKKNNALPIAHESG